MLNGSHTKTHFISSSGGNAGLAATTAAITLGHEATVVVPQTTGEYMRNKIIAAGGNVIVHGVALPDADEYVRSLVKKDPSLAYIPPFDHEDIWEGKILFLSHFPYLPAAASITNTQIFPGNSTVVDELYHQLNGSPPDAIICSVGGGGLLNGIMLGLARYGWEDAVTVVGMETLGADSLAASVRAGRLVTLPAITSIARSLGVTRVSDKTWEFAQMPNVKSVVLSDAQAAMACVRLADEENLIVEPACGVSVAACYESVLRRVVPGFCRESKVVVIVCGGKSPVLLIPYLIVKTIMRGTKADFADTGSNVSAETLVGYRKQYSGKGEIAYL